MIPKLKLMSRRGRPAAVLFILSALFTGTIPFSPLASEIALKHYKASQAKAGEYLEIRVKSVSLDWCLVCAKRKVVARAEVLKVHRTSARLKPGNTITIKYTTWTRRPAGWAGPRAIPILKKGQTYPAYLRRRDVNKRDGIICEPAARGYSFQTIKK